MTPEQERLLAKIPREHVQTTIAVFAQVARILDTEDDREIFNAIVGVELGYVEAN